MWPARGCGLPGGGALKLMSLRFLLLAQNCADLQTRVYSALDHNTECRSWPVASETDFQKEIPDRHSLKT